MSFSHISDLTTHTEIPVNPHLGGFGVMRKNHIHKGVDLYCEPNEPVYAVEDGMVAKRGPFTGTNTKTDWWNDTEYVSIQSDDHSILYGEIEVANQLVDGYNVKQGELIGHVKTVLKTDKGRPMTMLHFEMYESGIIEAYWGLGKRPAGLLNPTPLLIAAAGLYRYGLREDGDWVYIYDYYHDTSCEIVCHRGSSEFFTEAVNTLNEKGLI